MRFINFFGVWVPRVRRCIVLLPCKAKNIFLYSFSYSDVLLCHSCSEASAPPSSFFWPLPVWWMCSEVLPVIFLYPLQFLSSLLFYDYGAKKDDFMIWLLAKPSRFLVVCSMVTTWIIGGLMLITQTFFPLSATGGLVEAVWRLVGERKKMFIHQDNHQISSFSFPYKCERSELI